MRHFRSYLFNYIENILKNINAVLSMASVMAMYPDRAILWWTLKVNLICTLQLAKYSSIYAQKRMYSMHIVCF